MSKGVKIRGLDDLLTKFQKLKSEELDLTAAIFSGALIIQEIAVIKAPYDTGTLRRSITIRLQVTSGKILARIGTNLVYARRVEYGFADTDSLGRTFNQAGKPYLRPAYDTGKDKAIKEITGALAAQIKAKL